MKTLDAPLCPISIITRLKDYIFILCGLKRLYSIRVYQYSTPFDLQMIISLDKINSLFDLASSSASECLYVADLNTSCIWKIDIDYHVVTKWICNLKYILGITVSNDGEVVVLQSDEMSKKTYLEVYGSDAIFIRRVDLSPAINKPRRAIIKPDGQFIIVERLERDERYCLVITLLSMNGQIHGQAIVTGRGRYFEGMCWSFDTDAIRVNELDIMYNSECIVPPYDGVHLMLEEHAIPLFVSWKANGRGTDKQILIDVQVVFGIHSSKYSLRIFMCF